MASEQRGYICASPLGATSGWFEHSMCELHTDRPARPANKEVAEEWDRMYASRLRDTQRGEP